MWLIGHESGGTAQRGRSLISTIALLKYANDFAQSRGVKYCDLRVWVYVCLSIWMSASGFVDDVKVSHKGANGAESNMTVLSRSSVGGTGGKV